MKRLVYLAPVPLDSPSQRPHHFVEWAHARWDCEVWWVQPYPVRLPRRGDLRRVRKASAHGTPAGLGPTWHDAQWLHVVELTRLPVEPLPGGRALLRTLHARKRQQLLALLAQEDSWLAVGRPSGLALDLCKALQGRHVLYDVMDDMPQFSRGLSQRWMCHAHEALVAQAQAVWGSARQLVQSMQGRTRNAPALVRNGTVVPQDQPGAVVSVAPAALHAEAPWVIGYVGTIASWFDWEALSRLAQALPQAHIYLYGPLETTVPAGLPRQVKLFPAVPHAQVFGLLRGWHAGLIPFVKNRLTASVDPVKYYEYRACGLPVLTTLFGEMPHHASTDGGVWDMQDVQVLQTLGTRLLEWHSPVAGQAAQGESSARLLREASWAARFDAGVQAVNCAR
ncbi:MAG: glycosyltransferase family protein [Acidovorax defluvii]